MSIYGNDIFMNTKMSKLFDNYMNGPDESLMTESELNAIKESIDMEEGYGAKLRPVFIVLLYSDSTFDHVAEKFVKNQTYWHAALSFGPALSKCYSFNFGEANANKFKGGLSFESLDMYKNAHPTGTMEISCVFLNKAKYKQLQATMDYYLKNKEKTKYSFINLFYSLFGHGTKNGLKMNLVCSTFVDTILKSVKIDITNVAHTNLVKPDDLKSNLEKEKQFKIFEGKIVDYNTKKMRAYVNKLANDVSNDYFK